MRTAGVLAAALTLTLTVELAWGPGWPLVAGDTVAGAALLGAGGIALARRSTRITGVLLLAAGGAWLLGTAEGSLAALHRGALVHALLLRSDARLHSPPAVAATIAAYVTGLVPDLAVEDVATLAVAALVTVAAVPLPRAPARAAACVLAGALALGAISSLSEAGLGELVTWAYYIAVIVATLAAALPPGASVSGLVADLGGLETRDALRERLARALADPGLAVAFAGTPAPVPAADQEVTEVRDGDEVVAILVHDRGALRDAELGEAVASTARLSVANTRMQAEIVTRAREVAASRQRLVLTGDAQRRALELELRVTVGRRLEAVADHLEPGPLMDELERAQEDLRRLARGLHPVALTEGGLRAALTELVAGSPLPVTIDVPDERFPDPIEAGAYFVASEALANAAKHAQARQVTVNVRAAGRLFVEVGDDGTGGATFAGSGLIGIRDRVESLGGTIRLDSPPGAGTRIHAELPLP